MKTETKADLDSLLKSELKELKRSRLRILKKIIKLIFKYILRAEIYELQRDYVIKLIYSSLPSIIAFKYYSLVSN